MGGSLHERLMERMANCKALLSKFSHTTAPSSHTNYELILTFFFFFGKKISLLLHQDIFRLPSAFLTTFRASKYSKGRRHHFVCLWLHFVHLFHPGESISGIAYSKQTHSLESAFYMMPVKEDLSSVTFFSTYCLQPGQYHSDEPFLEGHLIQWADFTSCLKDSSRQIPLYESTLASRQSY